ncbi:N-acetylglucosamine kinase [Lacihabitans sp. LS3-19]|uniref:N-acetylglucosamine kinase n=1 Tax=Lacihabitans sp. LS3-19 TaxID=2487335 RepID=UPI0020CFD200|nr:N-acetylglucosamine kinase [Lacihabitans sp. LS3-19]MCP9769677.1 N-acetylglucosamine kinase [Lacihabitans sp. LS3-19]
MILIAESGSTKTDWRLLDQDQTCYTSIGLNPYFVDAERISAEISPWISKIENLKEVHFYGTGVTDQEKSEIIKKGILNALGYKVDIYTYSDVIAAAKSIFGIDEGIACILGTGSNSCFWNGSEISFQIPPLGFWLGDEGSGGHLGKSLILDYLHNEMPLDIRTLFEEKYGKIERVTIMTKSYKEALPNKYFANYTYFIFENLQFEYCKSLVKKSFEAFFQKYLLKYPNLKDEKIGFVGSIAFYFQDILKEICQNHEINIYKIIEKPIDGLVNFHQE